MSPGVSLHAAEKKIAELIGSAIRFMQCRS
jgi:hypothetical protein